MPTYSSADPAPGSPTTDRSQIPRTITIKLDPTQESGISARIPEEGEEFTEEDFLHSCGHMISKQVGASATGHQAAVQSVLRALIRLMENDPYTTAWFKIDVSLIKGEYMTYLSGPGESLRRLKPSAEVTAEEDAKKARDSEVMH